MHLGLNKINVDSMMECDTAFISVYTAPSILACSMKLQCLRSQLSLHTRSHTLSGTTTGTHQRYCNASFSRRVD
ncbi:hypothetical protein BU23DRAFT_502582, partial [Bimuria novae-zelandiae CBS 107.79]